MASVCFYFQVHQPLRLRQYRIYDIGKNSEYFDIGSSSKTDNKKIFKKVAEKCYLPANQVMLEILNQHKEWKMSYSFSGIFLEQAEEYAPEVVESFQKLIKTGRVEILSETYYHSLSFLYSKEEFKSQVVLHKRKIHDLFGVTPSVFRNTELIYNNELAKVIEELGYKGVLAEGADHILGWRSPNFLYTPKGCFKIKLMLKNYRLSDDIAFRFSEKSWKEYPLTAPKFAQWVNAINGNGNLINLFMDYETFGEHQWEDTGIFEFMRQLPVEILKNIDNDFVTPSEAIKRYKSVGELDVPNFISWADVERDLSAWISNEIQQEAIQKVYELEPRVKKTKNKKLLTDWRKLTTSDHFYYMCTKWFNDGDVHKYFSPYESPYEAFIYYMRVLTDVGRRVEEYEKN
jgi:alpha-amylase